MKIQYNRMEYHYFLIVIFALRNRRFMKLNKGKITTKNSCNQCPQTFKSMLEQK